MFIQHGHLAFEHVHAGFYSARSEWTGESYTVRTRPRGDGWMAIAGSYAITTGMALNEAMASCLATDKRIESESYE